MAGDGLEVLIDAFARHESSLDVARAAADAMWGLSVNDEVGALMEDMGCIDSLIKSAQVRGVWGDSAPYGSLARLA